ncbi:hypothetical protein B0181_08875 [Moraxella caviae]|uniref:Putative Fis-like DNA-binding protein n=1 Tax=Moraxella caviae TaxID=34060 RepID=A0A1S9ZX86_9GAMM|nr:helix-turn-helix domain-containing protein [Moraxella caviae]OOR88114.1 hypothetical protein B0181_08875 [Moraxella caviae]STZ10004.1 Hin recombinational enhancer-binding protein [Moraxella caviae]VEW12945.1 Hin recombinational enhancer-binding protein [Moraxella caviae]
MIDYTKTPDQPLSVYVEHAVQKFFENADTEHAGRLYEVFLHDLEQSLFAATLRHTNGNQSKTAELLGMNRGTLRTKLKFHGLI